MAILLLNVAWMRWYRGLTNDEPQSQHGFIKRDEGVPHEIYNFRPHESRCYGYAPVRNGTINIRNLGASGDSDRVNGVLVVWTAGHPAGGRFVIGWYKNAIVYRTAQLRPGLGRSKEAGRVHYNASAATENVRLLSVDERVFQVPTMQKGYPGMAAAFFADNNADIDWLNELRAYIETGVVPDGEPSQDDDGDSGFRKMVETCAVDAITEYYRQMKFTVVSCESDNIGWDLEARRGSFVLRLEVKGLSGEDPEVWVTPNEYKEMTGRYRTTYRICIVTNSHQTKRRKIRIFAYDKNAEKWARVDEEIEETLEIYERTGAKLSVA